MKKLTKEEIRTNCQTKTDICHQFMSPFNARLTYVTSQTKQTSVTSQCHHLIKDRPLSPGNKLSSQSPSKEGNTEKLPRKKWKTKTK
ncbi:hypothetical protein CEXT_803301 [Caerostris extrusa]|uniref:Uncharacterized protein n=1 Tax=Caerostris extrusa TaxID=172846 RepID=A0AAV4QZM3_CAEEX|nr:hypothetical protein CEXT_803301 [Caerostris extrusa]